MRPRFLAVSLCMGVAGLTLCPAVSRADAVRSPEGLAVIGQGDSAAAASTLARAIYGDPGLLPAGLDELRARVLVGDPVPVDAAREVRDLGETRAAIHGDDAPSRGLLQTLASSLRVKGLVVVEGHPGEKPSARVFVAGTGFDAVLYEPDPAAVATWGAGSSTYTWTSAASALHRAFADPVVAPVLIPAPAAALAPVPAPATSDKASEGGRPFYTSPWFWGAIGAAAFAGAAFYFATRDATDPNIQLAVQVPK